MKGMVRIKMKGVGYDRYTGMFGDAYFENAVSEWIPVRIADRISAIILVEKVDGDEPMYFERMQAMRTQPMAEPVKKVTEPQEVKLPTREEAERWTADQLAKIADEKGIAGLREIGDPLGIRSKSISDLIAKILEAQN